MATGLGDFLDRPFREILAASFRRDRRPLLIAETHVQGRRPLSTILLAERQREIFWLEQPDLPHQPIPAWTPEKDSARHAAF